MSLIRRRRLSSYLATIPEDRSCEYFSASAAALHYSAHHKRRRSFAAIKKRNRQVLRQMETNSYGLIDDERAIRGLGSLKRSSSLEHLALQHVTRMAKRTKVCHSVDSLPALQKKLQSTLVGENVQSGNSVVEMHHFAMAGQDTSRSNILGAEFTQVGVAVCKGRDSQMYMCQLFR